MLIPDFITFTGADDQTDIAAMERLSARYPVEFAILFSATRAGTPRYPGRTWTDTLRGRDLRLAAHICGHWAREIVETGGSQIQTQLLDFDRIQINTPVTTPEALDRVAAFGARMSEMRARDTHIILQVREAFPADERFHWLLDASGGRGVVRDSYPEPPTSCETRFGYAGGIGPENVREVLSGIPAIQNAWIDMETRIRNGKDEFDLGMCHEVCDGIPFAT